MSTYPPGYAAPEVPIFVPEADAISSFNTGSLAIAAGGEIIMNYSEETHAVQQFNKDVNGLDFVSWGIRSIPIVDASGVIVESTNTLSLTNADDKFDGVALAGINLYGYTDVGPGSVPAAIYGGLDGNIRMAGLIVSSINGAQPGVGGGGVTSVQAGQGIQVSGIGSMPVVGTNLLAGANITLTPSKDDTSITVSAANPISTFTYLQSVNLEVTNSISTVSLNASDTLAAQTVNVSGSLQLQGGTSLSINDSTGSDGQFIQSVGGYPAWTTLPLTQYGIGTFQGGEFTVILPISYDSNLFSVVVTPQVDISSTPYAIATSISSFTVNAFDINDVQFNWITIGMAGPAPLPKMVVIPK
jgi:hypothetical protein